MTLLGDITVLYYYQVLGYLEPNNYMQQQQSLLSLSLSCITILQTIHQGSTRWV